MPPTCGTRPGPESHRTSSSDARDREQYARDARSGWRDPEAPGTQVSRRRVVASRQSGIMSSVCLGKRWVTARRRAPSSPRPLSAGPRRGSAISSKPAPGRVARPRPTRRAPPCAGRRVVTATAPSPATASPTTARPTSWRTRERRGVPLLRSATRPSSARGRVRNARRTPRSRRPPCVGKRSARATFSSVADGYGQMVSTSGCR